LVFWLLVSAPFVFLGTHSPPPHPPTLHRAFSSSRGALLSPALPHEPREARCINGKVCDTL
jgi:hypothetical protein